LKQLRDTLAGFKHKLTENKAAKVRIKDNQAAIDSQKKELFHWGAWSQHGPHGVESGLRY